MWTLEMRFSWCIVGVLICLEIDLAASEFVNKSLNVATTQKSIIVHPLQRRISRGMDLDEHYFEMHDYNIEKAKPMPKAEKESRKTDNWGSQYYDFLINEGSYKFWAVFQLVTAALLIYSAFAAIYYAKFNLVTADYDYDYGLYGGGRQFDGPPTTSPFLGLSPQTFQAILNAISSTKFS